MRSFNNNTSNKDKTTEVIGTLDGYAFECIARVYSIDGLCPTLSTMGGGDRQPKIFVKKESL